MTNAPVFEELTRNADGSLRARWTNRAETGKTYTAIYFEQLVDGRWLQINSIGYPAISNQIYDLYTPYGGGAFRADTAYSIRMYAFGPAGASPRSNARSVAAVPRTQPPRLDSAVRLSNGNVQFTWTNVQPQPLQRYDELFIYQRVGGVWRHIRSLSTAGQINAQSYTQTVAHGGAGFRMDTAYEFAMAAAGPAGLSDYSSSRSIAALKTPTPTLVGVERTGAGTARVTLSQNHAAPATTQYTNVWGRANGTGTLRNLGRTVGGTDTVVTLTGLDGAATYDIYLVAYGPAGSSDPSQSRTIERWWQQPSAVQNLQGERLPNGASTLTWSGSGTDRAPWNALEVWRREGATGQFSRIASLPGTARSYTDTAADPAKTYWYEVRVISPGGEASATTGQLGPTVNVPNPPSNVSAAYLDPNQVRVSWQRNVAAGREYTGQQIGWRNHNPATDGAWTWITVGSSATQGTVSPGANRVIETTVRAQNAAGWSDLASPAGPVTTTPSAPASLAAGWAGNVITVTIPNYSTVGDRLMLEFSTDGTEWYPAATLATSARTWSHTGRPVGVPHYYRAWVETDATGTPNSAIVYAGTVPALTRPAPPTLSPPDSVDATEDLAIGVRHNPLDGTAQTSGNFRHRKMGTSMWVTAPLGTSAQGVIPAGTYANGDTVEVSAQTAGATGELSEWSTLLNVRLRARPSVTITEAGRTTTWTASAQESATVELLDPAGEVIDTRTVAAGDRQVTWANPLEDQATYTVRLVVRDQYQPSHPVTATFVAELDRPSPPTLVAAMDETTAVVTADVTGDPATHRFVLRRRNPDGTWTPVAESTATIDDDAAAEHAGSGFWTVSFATAHTGEGWWSAPHASHTGDGGWQVGAYATGSMVDPLAPLNGATYVVRAYSAEGGWSESEHVTVAALPGSWYLINWGTGLATVARCRLNPSVQVAAGRTRTLRRYVGDDDPSTIHGSRQPFVLSASFALDPDEDTPLAEWERLSQEAEDVVWRDPSGRVIKGAFTGFTADDSTSIYQSVSFTVTRAK